MLVTQRTFGANRRGSRREFKQFECFDHSKLFSSSDLQFISCKTSQKRGKVTKMTLTISQETFDEVVKENMEEFEMTEEEAVEEAKNQFKAQGVNLSNIIMTCSSAAVVYRVIKSLEKLLPQSYPDRDEDIAHELAIVKVELDKELAIRVRAGKEGLYPLLIRCLKHMEPQYLLQVLETLTSLTNGYPDLLDQHGLEFMMGFLHVDVDVDLIVQNLKWIKNCVTAHEKNRAELIKLKIPDSFRHLLIEFQYKARVVIQICQVIRKLVCDDDIRVVHGNPHEHARKLASETLCLLISLLKCHEEDVCVLYEVIPAITALIVRDEFCLKVYEQNGLRYTLDAMIKYPDDERINRSCLCLLKGLAGSDYVKEPIIQNGAAPLIVSAMYRHKISPMLVGTGCVCISALALRSPSNAQHLVDAGSPELLIMVMNMYKDNHVILKNACWAVRNHVSRCPNLRDQFKELGIEDLLNEIKEKEGKLEFECKGVLRDLGCDVKFEEEWKGEGHQLKNGCWAIRNIVARSHEFRSKFAALGAEMLLNEARKKFAKEMDYEARITLRDLGCEIEEEFPWPKKSQCEVST